MNLILFDDPGIRSNLLPLTFTRPVAEVRVGILTIAAKWERYLGAKPSYSTQPQLARKFQKSLDDDNLWINGAVCPDEKLVGVIGTLKPGDAIFKNARIIAVRTGEDELPEVIGGKVTEYAH